MIDQTSRLAHDVRLACQLVSRRVRFESDTSLGVHQVAVLFRLRKCPLTPGELAEAEQVSSPSMTKTLGGLEELGLVTRAPDPGDGRRRIVSITDAGREALETVVTTRDTFMVSALASLTEDERAVLAEASQILRRVME